MKNKRSVMPMDDFFNMEWIEVKDEVYHVAEELREMDSDEISMLIDMYEDRLACHYLERQRLLGNRFYFDEIEPFVEYLDKYLLERSGGNREKLRELSVELTGKKISNSTQRLQRLQILDSYFEPYLKD